MIRLALFVLAYLSAAVIVSLGIERALRPHMRRRELLRAAAERWSAARDGDAHTCSICLKGVVFEKDAFDKQHGWFHVACMTRLLND